MTAKRWKVPKPTGEQWTKGQGVSIEEMDAIVAYDAANGILIEDHRIVVPLRLLSVGRRMSCSMTTQQVRDRVKDVTRRDPATWAKLKPGDQLTLVEKAMGLKKGEHHVILALVEIVSVRLERLDAITADECRREGFPGMTPEQFIEMFCKSHKGIMRDSLVRRIEWEYIGKS